MADEAWGDAGDAWTDNGWTDSGNAAGSSSFMGSGGDRGGGSNTGCRICKEDGHFARDCPMRRTGGGGGGGRGCHNCGEEGHMARECPKPRDGGGAGGSSSRTCHNCKGEGHFAKDCTEPRTGGGGDGGGCRNCGEVGHFARDCTQPAKALAPGEKPKENYIPKEADEKDLYELQGLISGINFSKYDNIKVNASGNDLPKAVKNFGDLELRPLLAENVNKCGYKTMTPVQRFAIPCVLAMRDVMACAQTGSGKTAAFLIPIVQHLLGHPPEMTGMGEGQSPSAVVIAPTRELAIQIHGEARKFSSGSAIKPVVVYGGTNVLHQKATVQRGVDILIGTVGRLGDFLERGVVNFDQVKFLVLDEADRMLEQGNLAEVSAFVNRAGMLPKGERVTLMFSATYPEEIQNMAKDMLTNYIFLAIGIVGAACTDVKQTFLQVARTEKRQKVLNLLQEIGANRTIIFVETKTEADRLGGFLCVSGVSTTTIHGDRYQREREEALWEFRKGVKSVLVATGVASRGLDIKDVANVINYDLPKSVDEYVHRIGRTGRLGNEGRAVSFFDPSRTEDLNIGGSLVGVLEQAQQEVPDFLAQLAGRGGSASFGGGAFGASDIRGGEQQQYEEEVWD